MSTALSQKPESTYVREVKRKKPVKWWHEAIVDDMLAFPLSTLADRAARLGRYTPAYLSVIINSDMFQAYYKSRRALYQDELQSDIAVKTAHAAGKALDILLETMDKKRTEIPFDKLAHFADRSLERLGYGNGGGKAGVQVNVQHNSVTVTPEELETARNTIRVVESQRVALPSPADESEEVA